MMLICVFFTHVAVVVILTTIDRFFAHNKICSMRFIAAAIAFDVFVLFLYFLFLEFFTYLAFSY